MWQRMELVCRQAWARFLLSSGAKGKRFCLPHAKVMIHQPSSGTHGKVTDMEIDMKETLEVKGDASEDYGKKHWSEVG